MDLYSALLMMTRISRSCYHDTVPTSTWGGWICSNAMDLLDPQVKAVEASAAASSRKQQIHEEHKRPRMDLNAMRLPAKKTGDGSAARWRVWRRLSGSATPRRTEERRARRQEHQEQNSNGNGWQW